MQRCAENCSMLHAPLSSSKDSQRRLAAKTLPRRLGCFICTKFINSSRKLNTRESSSRPKLRLSRVERGVTVSVQKTRLPQVPRGVCMRSGVVFIAFVCLRMKNIQKNIIETFLNAIFPFSIFLCLICLLQTEAVLLSLLGGQPEATALESGTILPFNLFSLESRFFTLISICCQRYYDLSLSLFLLSAFPSGLKKLIRQLCSPFAREREIMLQFSLLFSCSYKSKINKQKIENNRKLQTENI